MKKSKILSLVLALTLLLVAALPMTASAAPLNNDGSIIIVPPEILVLTANQFRAYKLYDVTAINGTKFVYEPVQAVKDFLKTLTLPAYGVTTDPNTDANAAAEEFRVWLQNYQTTMDEPDIIALANVMLNTSMFDSGGNNSAVKQTDGSIKFSGLDYGYYFVVGKGRPHDSANNGTVTPPTGMHTEDVFSRGMLINVPELVPGEEGLELKKDVVCNLKADAPTIDKEVWNHTITGADDPTDTEDPGWINWTDVNIGDTVYFKHVSAVPDMTGYAKYKFIVHDYMSPGLDFNNDVKVWIGGVEVDGEAFDELTYTVTTPAMPASTTEHPTAQYVGGTYIVIEFDATKFVNLTAGDAIVITYTAELNEDAIIGAPGNPNKVWLEYSNSPKDGGEGTGETPEHKVVVYTFDVEILKYDGDAYDAGEAPKAKDDYPLAGVEFEMKRKTGEVEGGANNGDPIFGGDEMEFIALTGDPDGYDYRLPEKGETGTTTTLVTNGDGYIRIKGLDAGVYQLEETKAPAGYTAGFKTVITITHTDGEGAYTVTTAAGAGTISIENRAGGILPGTGGIGKKIFYSTSAVLTIGLLCMAVFFVIRKKRNLLNAPANA